MMNYETTVVTPPFMGAESCEKSESLQTFLATFLMYALYGSKKLRKKFGNFHIRQYRAIWSKSLQTFCVANVAEESCAAEKIPVRGWQNHELFSRITQPIQSVVHNHTSEPHTTHTTPNMDGHG